MNKNTMAVAAVIALALALAGCASSAPGATSNESTHSAQVSIKAQKQAAPRTTASASPQAAPTTTGDVCDPHNLNDTICAAFYPDQAVLNMTSAPRSGEPLASLTDAERISLAHKACDQLASGATERTVNVIETSPDDAQAGKNNSFTLASAGALAYCPQYLPDDTFGQSIKWTLDKYRSMGEEAAKESFKNGVVVKP